MEILIFIIMVAVVILNAQKKNAKKKPQTVQQVNQRAQQRNSQQQSKKPNQTQAAALAYQKQYKAKEQNKSNNAMAHVDARVADERKNKEAQFHSMSGARNVVPIEVDTDRLMSKVNDLMITGYNGELSYSRDFIAEGIDMLNRIQG